MNEVTPIALPEAKDDLVIGKTRRSKRDWRSNRPVLSVSLPFCFTRATPPRPDPSHPPSVVGGAIKRYGYKPPKINKQVMRRFKKFVKMWLRHNLKPLTDTDVPSFDEWLDNTPYSAARKEELRRNWNNRGRKLSKKDARIVKAFIKDETYPEYKYPRHINSRCDAAKCFFGPIMQACGDKLFSLDWFIKTVPVVDRPKVIYDTLVGNLGPEAGDYIFTDYTAFEAHFILDVMKVTDGLFFGHMASQLDEAMSLEFMLGLTGIVFGDNFIITKDVNFGVEATRMSGEMNTSLSNGFANLMLFLFLAHENGASDIRGFVEGDDGLFRVTPASAAPTAEQFAELGMTIKIGTTTRLAEASFCGQVYSMDSLTVVTDPKEALCRLGWSNKRYARAKDPVLLALLRARAYSLVYQYNGCPMLAATGYRLLELTKDAEKDVDRVVQHHDWWERAKLIAARQSVPEPKKIDESTRALVEKTYGVSRDEQIQYENWVSNAQLGQHSPSFETPQVWEEYFERYSTTSVDPDPCWLLKPEEPFLDALAKVKNTINFIDSILGGG